MTNSVPSVLNPFNGSVALYRKAGWGGTLPLPYKEKHPPPTGYTGHRAENATVEKLKEWMKQGRQNIGLRLWRVDKEGKNEVIGIDVDHYAKGDKNKRGGDQLSVLEEKLGVLPATWISSARTDGKSGIRYFLVPSGLAFRGQVDKDIECISKGYRFAVVWPSVHPEGGTYWWYPPGIVPDASGREKWSGELPCAKDLPLLPHEWLEYLTNGLMQADEDVRIDNDSSVDELYEWADNTFYGEDDDEPCRLMRKKLDTHKRNVIDEATLHDKITNAHWNIVNLAFEGHIGFASAIREFNECAADFAVGKKRGLAEIQKELKRSLWNALRKVKAKSDDQVKIGAAPVAMACSCGAPGTHLDTSASSDGDGNDPIGDIPGGSLKNVGEYETNDDGNAEHFRDMFSTVENGPSFRWVEGYGWIIWHQGDNPHWERDELGDQIMRRMWFKVKKRQQNYVEALYADMQNQLASTTTGNNGQPTLTPQIRLAQSKYNKWSKFVEANGNNRNAENALKAAKSLSGVTIKISELDANPLLLGVKNGIIELDNEEVRLRDASPNDLVTLNTNVDWVVPNDLARNIWYEYLETVIPDPDLRTTVKIAMGHCLLGGNPENKIIVLRGQPRTGKSTMVDAVLAALGTYSASVNQSVFQYHKLNPILADSLSKRVIVCSEFGDADSLDAATIKRLTGEDKIRAELKGSNAVIDEYPQFVPIIASNEVPPIRGADKALENRLYVIPFNHRPEHIKIEIKRMVKTVCRPAVLAWLIEGYQQYRISGLPMNKSIQDETKQFASELDEVASFIYENLVIHSKKDSSSIRWQDNGEWCIQSGKMYEKFEAWWFNNKLHERDKPSHIKFTRRMKALGYPVVQLRVGTTSGKFYVGVKLVANSVVIGRGRFDHIKPEKLETETKPETE